MRTGLAAAILLFTCALPGLAADSPGGDRVVQEGGITVQMELAPLDPARPGVLREEDDVVLRFRIQDANTGQPLAGLDPAAWMDRLQGQGVSDPLACRKQVEELVAGSLLKRPQIDFNVYYVLALNDDASISVVDPLFGFGGTRLLAMVPLLSPGEDWTLTLDQKRLFVSQPDAGRVAVVDAASWKVEAQLDPGPRPARVALQPDGAHLWIGIDSAADGRPSGVAVADARDLRILARIATGAGHHEIAFSADSGFAFVTNQTAGTVSVIDARHLEKIADVATGPLPVSIAWSSLANAAFTGHEGDGAIVAVDRRGHVVTRLAAAPGLGQIRFAPGGRYGFAVAPRTNSLFIVDAAMSRVIQSGAMGEQPDQVTFSDDLAYVRHRGSATVLMIPLREIGTEGKQVPVADFPGGQHPFGQGRRPSPADSIMRAPEANAVLVANPADQVIYYYKEGMAAPMGSFQTYDREPRAILVVDRSLQERSRPGTYETVARLHGPGRYDVAFFLSSPRVIHCFPVEVQVDPAREAARRKSQPAKVEPVMATTAAAIGQAVPVRFRFSDPETGAPLGGLQDVEVLIYRTDSNAQIRESARQVGDGLYEVMFTPQRDGSYVILVECPSRHLPFHLSPQVVLRVTEEKATSSP